MTAIMKFCIALWACSFTVETCKANSIDSLKTKKDVIAFFAKNLNKQFHLRDYNILFRNDSGGASVLRLQSADTVKIEKYVMDQMRATYRSNNFYKVDIDCNGRTDLVLDAICLIVVMDMGDGYKIHFIDDDMYNFYLYKGAISLADGSNAFLLRRVPYGWGGDTTWQTDTIVYRFNGLVEYNRHFKTVDISKISFSGYSIGSNLYSEFCLEINKDGRCFFNGMAHNSYFNRDGKYLFNNNETATGFLSFIAFADLRWKRDNYSIRISHGWVSDIAIYFEDGYIKKIHTFAAPGTIGLLSLNEMLFELIGQQGWQTTDYITSCWRRKDN